MEAGSRIESGMTRMRIEIHLLIGPMLNRHIPLISPPPLYKRGVNSSVPPHLSPLPPGERKYLLGLLSPAERRTRNAYMRSLPGRSSPRGEEYSITGFDLLSLEAELSYDGTMWTRRRLLTTSFWVSLTSVILNPLLICWAAVKRILPKGFSKEELKNLNPAEIDSRNLDVDPLDKFGTMGPTDVPVNLKEYRLKVTGKVEHPLALTYDQILKYPSLTETVLLICPGFFSNNGRWTGVSLKPVLQAAKIKKEAKYVDIKGAHGKVVRIGLEELDKKRIILAYRVNGETLPQKHGFPLRLVYEDAYGSDWVKYVDEIVVL